MPEVPDQNAAVKLTRVSRVYGGFAALKNVSVEVPAGSSVMILGENGAGKSTLLRMVAGLLMPSFGAVEVFGGAARHQMHRIAYMSHETMLYDELTGLENLRYFARVNGGARLVDGRGALRPEAALEAVGLDPGLPRRVGEYSQGMRQRAALARVMMAQPDLLLLDEPFSNLDVESARGMVELLQRFVAETGTDGRRRTLLLTTHQAELAKPLAGTTIRLHRGELVEVTEAAA